MHSVPYEGDCSKLVYLHNKAFGFEKADAGGP